MAVKTIFPITRVHEPLKIDVDVQGGRVTDAWLGATLFRGFETMLAGRDPQDAALFTQRICGICSSAHAVASALMLQDAFQLAPTPNGQLLINLIFAADLLQNHLRHFYVLTLFDYATGPEIPPYVPRLKGDYRLPPERNAAILDHARQGLAMAVRAHEMMAVFGAKAPMQQTILATGVTEQASVDRLAAYRSILGDIGEFVENIYLPDVMTIADYYPDYYQIGAGYGNFMSYGMFPVPNTDKREFTAGLIASQGRAEELDIRCISEDVRCSWYRDTADSRKPGEGTTVPDIDKTGAYTWVKAPRYDGLPLEGGPLARGWINGDYRRGVSVMDRIVARAKETQKVVRLAEEWLKQIAPGGPTFVPYTLPRQGEGAGLTDAMRGALGHWLKVKDGRISHYQVVTPTTWNFSPRDSSGKRGPVEEALVGTPVADADSLIEVGRVIRSFDPCFTCAVHAIHAPQAKIII